MEQQSVLHHFPEAIPRLAIASVGVIVAYNLVSIIYNYFFSPLRHVPGPFLARFTRLWELLHLRRGNFNKELIALHEKYGPVVRLSPSRYSFNSTEDMKKIYSLNDRFVKTDYYKGFGDPNIHNMLSLKDEQAHTRRKRAIASLYSMSTMVNYEGLVDRTNKVFVEKFTEFSNHGAAMPLYEFCQFYAFDVIGQITWDQDFGMIREEKDKSGVIPFIAGLTTYGATVGLFPEFTQVVFQVLRVYGAAAGNIMNNYIQEVVSKSQRMGPQPKADPRSESFFTKMLSLDAQGKINPPRGPDPGTLVDVVGANIGAGSETTGISLSAAFWYLYTHPDKLARLREEIDTGAANGHVSDPVTFAETQDMPYLQAVIKEVLRVHPAVGVILPRQVPKDGAQLGGYFFPEKTEVGCSAWPLHYNVKEIDRPDEFRPERWLEEDGHKKRMTESFAFGAGSRTCLGKNVSILEISKVLPQIVRKFDVEILGSHENMPMSGIWFFYPEYQARISRRN